MSLTVRRKKQHVTPDEGAHGSGALLPLFSTAPCQRFIGSSTPTSPITDVLLHAAHMQHISMQQSALITEQVVTLHHSPLLHAL